MPTRTELKAELAKLKADSLGYKAVIAKTDEAWEAEAADVTQRLESSWAVSFAWMKALQGRASRTLTAISPFGRIRHLNGYVHGTNAASAGMDRRGPNAVIQGAASEAATMSGHLTGEFAWRLFGRDTPFDLKLHNMVHDSQSWTCPLHLLPVMAYFVEHGMTTLTQNFYGKVFNFKMQVPFGIDMEFGFNEADLQGWDLRVDSLEAIANKLCDQVKASRSIRKALAHNIAVVGKMRTAELKKFPNGGMLPQATKTEWWLKNIKWKAKG